MNGVSSRFSRINCLILFAHLPFHRTFGGGLEVALDGTLQVILDGALQGLLQGIRFERVDAKHLELIVDLGRFIGRHFPRR